MTPRNDAFIDESVEELYENAPCGYLYTAPDGTVVKANRTFCEWSGFARDEIVGAKRFNDLLTVPGKIYFETHFAPLLAMQGFLNEIALDLVAKNGESLPTIASAAQKRDDDGNVLFTRLTLSNATDRRRYERELLLARRRAEHSAKTNEELLLMISHDMRTPLNSLTLISQLLERSPLSPEQGRYVKMLRSSADTLLDLANNILQFGELEGRRVALQAHPFDVREMLDRVLSTVGPKAGEKELELRADVDAAIPARLLGDPIKIAQIMTNLLANAIKFTERGSVVLDVRLRGATDDSVELAFAVRDTGIGIPPDRRRYIFDAFTQADYGTALKYGGSGLGLAITRRLLQLHGSKIELESTLGEGSIFSFALQLKRA